MSQINDVIICDFSNTNDISNWKVVNDGVMGGVSKASFVLNNAGNALYSGTVSTANNGGFSSVNFGFKTKQVSGFKTVVLKIKGDGKSYQFRLKSDSSERYWYISSFKTSGNWELIKLPLNMFYPSFRGDKLDKPNFSDENIEEIAFLIGNAVNEQFSLEVEKIYLE